MLTIAVLGTLDTKGSEHTFVADRIREAGHNVLLIDVGTHLPPTVKPDLTREDIIAASNAIKPVLELVSKNDRGESIGRMANLLPPVIRQLADQGKINGIISLGGSGGTAIATAAMRSLPIGFPKVMVSTLAASSNVAQYVDVSDIAMFPSIVDVSGLNRISEGVFARAAAAVVAMAEANTTQKAKVATKPLIVASMFGNTTKCIEHAKKIFEQEGFEVIVFHATGIGGRTMEALIDSGIVAGVFDITTTEWADELVGGVLSSGPQRLEAAARKGVPTVIAPGCLDMVNFGEQASIPKQFEGRNFYQHNPQVTLMRTTPGECEELGKIIASKANLSTGPVQIFFPLKAISVISAAGQAFHDPAADTALLESLRRHLRSSITLEEVDCEINDSMFAERSANRLLELIRDK